MKITKPVFYLGLASLLSDLAGEMIYPLLPVFFARHLGAGVVFLGVFEGVAEAVASLAKYVGGRWSDRAGRREAFVFWGYVAANVVRPLIALVAAPWQAVALRAVDRTGKGLRTSPRDAWLAELAAREDRGAVYGFHRAMDHAGATLGPLVATAFLFFFPGELRTLFLLALLPGLAAAWAVRRAARAQPPRPIAADRSVESWRPSWVWAPPAFKAYLGVLALFTLGMASDAFLLLKLRDVGVPDPWIPALWAGLHVVKSASSTWGGRLSDLWGRKPAILLGWGLYALFYAGFGAASDRGLVVALFLAYGVFYGLTEGPEKALVADLAPAGRQGEAFGLFHLVVGVMSLPASALFGILWKAAGPPAAFYAVAGLSVVCAAVLAALRLPPTVRAR